MTPPAPPPRPTVEEGCSIWMFLLIPVVAAIIAVICIRTSPPVSEWKPVYCCCRA